jgi:hypothetical protein
MVSRSSKQLRESALTASGSGNADTMHSHLSAGVNFLCAASSAAGGSDSLLASPCVT